MKRPKIFKGAMGSLLALGLAGAIAASAAAAPPAQTANPTLEGPAQNPFVGDKLTVSNGGWSGSPTKFSYEWKRCDPTGDRRNCVTIPGATSQSYTVSKADVNHKLDAIVTASNADGSASSDASSGVVSDAAPPANLTRPTISGSPTVGSTLTANNGTWRGATSFGYVWQQCDQNGNSCVNIAGATGRTYGVRSADVGHELRVQVTGRNRFGNTPVLSNLTPVVTSNTPTTTSTTVVTTTVAGNKAPTIQFLSLKRIGQRIYARFYVCDDGSGRVTVIERDNKARALSITRRFAVSPCATYTRNWLLAARFRHPGRFAVTLRAQDRSGRLSLIRSRSLTFR
ncbi:MAG: hypothetical protein QOF43_668 [Gaiellaceae bacterium]|nr:hypothetical protein [Gaiellaceae bacterium]